MGLIRFLMFAGVALLVFLIYRRFVAGPLRSHFDHKEDERLGRLVQDPNCGVYVDSRDAVRRKVRGGDLYFCSRACAKTYFKEQRGG